MGCFFGRVAASIPTAQAGGGAWREPRQPSCEPGVQKSQNTGKFSLNKWKKYLPGSSEQLLRGGSADPRVPTGIACGRELW